VRRLLRIAFNALTLLSLVLALLVAGLWVRSQWRHDVWVMNSAGVHRVFHSQSGRLSFSSVRADDTDGNSVIEDWKGKWNSLPVDDRPSLQNGVAPWQRVLGLGWNRVSLSGTSATGMIKTTAWTWWVAYRLVAICFAMLPAIVLGKRLAVAWRSRVQLGRQRRGRCAMCGYDLHATPDRCPECGASSVHS
jgi:hypothetical protein